MAGESNHKNLRVCFMGSRQVGIIGALTVLAEGNSILSAVSYSEQLKDILELLAIPQCRSINDNKFIAKLKEADVLLCVHGKEIVRPDFLKLPRLGCINLHPYLYKYKGANPVGRALKDGEIKASVGAHIMEAKVDFGRVLVEEFIDVSGANSVEEIYNLLYPYYGIVVLKALEVICRENKKNKK
jgi:methionyl-tRNA formyltransferase